MTDYAQISDVWQGILALFAVLAFLMSIYNLIRCIQLGRKLMCVPTAVLLSAAFALIQIMAMNAYKYPHYPLGIHLKVAPTIAAVLLLIAASGLRQYRLGRWNRSHLSPMSIKESFDNLPAGLCYYLKGGLIKLVNTSMNELSSSVSGMPLMNPEQFYDDLERGALPASLRGGEAPMVRLSDGRVFRFSHRVFDTEIGLMHELVATDVTDNYNLNLELAEKQVRARELNARLKALLGSIEYLTMSRELTRLKAELHDELGKSLLLSKRYLESPGSVDAPAVRDSWLKKLNLLENSGRESWQTPYFVLKEQAEALGISLEIQGDLPSENYLIPVVETALSVHMTNVLRHAGGGRAVVVCEKEETGYRLALTNDGAAPPEEVREGGGLTNLRTKTEAVGGNMTVDSAPAFQLNLYLPINDWENL